MALHTPAMNGELCKGKGFRLTHVTPDDLSVMVSRKILSSWCANISILLLPKLRIQRRSYTTVYSIIVLLHLVQQDVLQQSCFSTVNFYTELDIERNFWKLAADATTGADTLCAAELPEVVAPSLLRVIEWPSSLWGWWRGSSTYGGTSTSSRTASYDGHREYQKGNPEPRSRV